MEIAVIWLSGPGGAGKSTICQLLGRREGFVFYEADAMMNFANPFVPTDVENPSLATKQQKSLKVKFSQLEFIATTKHSE